MKQKFIIHIISIAAMIALMTSCASGKIILSNDANISKYKYVIFGKYGAQNETYIEGWEEKI